MDVLGRLEARGYVQQNTHPDELREALSAGPLTLYVGFDPTAPSLHLGHLLQIMVMANLQRAGHRVIALVGGGTARVGDPTGKTEMRQMLSDEQIAENSAGLRRQLEHYLVLDGERGVMVDNADWLMGLTYIPFLRDVGRHFSVNRMLAAETYKIRLERGLSFIEFNYQIFQAYDFLELNRRYGCALQIGGDDQWSNIIAGVDLVRRVEQRSVWGMTTPLLLTASGEKMGKTAKGAVWLDPALMSPFDFWQYWYNVDDRDVIKLIKLYTFLDDAEVAKLAELKGADLRIAKRILANEVTTLAHGADAAQAADAGAKAMAGSEASADLPTHTLAAPGKLFAVLTAAGLASSNSDARRLVAGGGVTVDGAKQTDADVVIAPSADGVVLRVGKKRAVRVIAPA